MLPAYRFSISIHVVAVIQQSPGECWPRVNSLHRSSHLPYYLLFLGVTVTHFMRGLQCAPSPIDRGSETLSDSTLNLNALCFNCMQNLDLSHNLSTMLTRRGKRGASDGTKADGTKKTPRRGQNKKKPKGKGAVQGGEQPSPGVRSSASTTPAVTPSAKQNDDSRGNDGVVDPPSKVVRSSRGVDDPAYLPAPNRRDLWLKNDKTTCLSFWSSRRD